MYVYKIFRLSYCDILIVIFLATCFDDEGNLSLPTLYPNSDPNSASPTSRFVE